jgi:hypothetical protein
MKRPLLRRVIARRTYDLAGPFSSGVTGVTVEFSAPVRSPGSTSYRCFYRIRGLKEAGLRYGAGADTIQALMLAMANAAALLYNSTEWKEGRLTLCGTRNLDLPLIRVGEESAVPDQTLQLDL